MQILLGDQTSYRSATGESVTTSKLYSIMRLVCFVVFHLCYLYSLIKMDSGVLFYLV